MKHVRQVLSPSPAQVQRLLQWAVVVFVLPLALFVAVAMLLGRSHPQVIPVKTAELWQEPLGNIVFGADNLASIVQTAPDFSQAKWQQVTFPNTIELPASADFPLDAPKVRAWFRIRVPPELRGTNAPPGRLGLMSNRIMGGPWAVWVDGRLVQANLADWRIQWNTPMRAMLPLDVAEILVAVPYAQVQGYAVGSMFIGPSDAVDQAWQMRNFWLADAPRAASLVALLLMLMSFHLAINRRKEPLFALLGVSALFWSISNLQYFYDFTGQDTLSQWFATAMDVSITWVIVFTLLFAYEFEKIKMPRLRVALLLYACGVMLITLPIWHWDKTAMLAQHFLNATVDMGGICVLLWHVYRAPTREGIALCVSLLVQLALGVHNLLYLSNQTDPDQVFTYPFGVVFMFLVFMYVTSRRTVMALNTGETYQADLQAQLAVQQQRLAAQHALMQRMEIENRLTTQRETILQDLHDGLGSNLTSALLQARSGKLTQDSALLLLQDLTDELRNLSKSSLTDQRTPNEILAALRQRIQNRLSHADIQLVWDVCPTLPDLSCTDPAAGQHLRALLSEATANIIKHTKATQIRVSAQVQGDAVVIEVTDNGLGFSPDSTQEGRGLPGMRQRARALGGRLDITSELGRGTRWRLSLPHGPR